VHLTFSGCPAALTYPHPGPGCNQWTRESLAWLERHREITHVLIVYRWSYHLFGDQLKTFPNMPDERPKFLPELSGAAARERFWNSFVTLTDRLRAAGKTVVIVRPIPDLPVAVERYVYHGVPANGMTGMTRLQADSRNQWTNGRLDTLIGKAGIKLINPADSLCDIGRCWSIRDGRALYIDDNHPSLVGARQLLSDAAARGLLD
jgi:SGNH domain (fused to AT3 domains)